MQRKAWILLAGALMACSSTNQSAPSTTRPFAQGGGGDDQPSRPAARGTPMSHERCLGSSGEVDQRDVNGDGRADVQTVVRNGHPFCRETDANFDGKADIIRFFDEQGRPTRVEDDYDFDGKIDVVATYENGEIKTDVLDTNFDGREDTWREYAGGKVIHLRRDSNSDGRVDMWEDFDDSGQMTRSAVDANGDGTPDDQQDSGVAPLPATAGSGLEGTAGGDDGGTVTGGGDSGTTSGGATTGTGSTSGTSNSTSTSSGMGGTAPPPTTGGGSNP